MYQNSSDEKAQVYQLLLMLYGMMLESDSYYDRQIMPGQQCI
jgi:hypothetical protein